MAMVVQQQQQQHQSSGSSGGRSPNGNTSNNGGSSQNQGVDTTYTKIFVGGLAWETKRETMKKHFEQYGDIQEAVVIMDKNTGRSKGYGFVTFKEAEAAKKACADPTPVIDGRRANCNLASLGAHRGSRPSPPPHSNRFRPSGHFQGASQGTGMPAYNGGLAYPPPGPYAYQPGYPYSPFGFPAYPPDFSVAQGYYNPYATPQFPPQVYTGPMYPHAQAAAAAGYSSSPGPGYMQAPHIVHYSGPGLVASTPPTSQYTVASVPHSVQTSGMPLTGGSSVAMNRSPGQAAQPFTMTVPLKQYAAVAASEQTAT